MKIRITMKTRLIIAILLMTCATAWAGKDVEVIKKAEGKGHVGGKRWAIVVGVNNYDDPRVNDLQFAVNDAKIVSEALRSSGLFDRVFLFADGAKGDFDEEPTFMNILKKVNVVSQNAGPDDMILFYFSGHGFPDPKEGHNYLAAKDTDPDMLLKSGIGLQELYRFLNDSQARAKVVLLDACHSGARKDKGDVYLNGNYLYNGEGSVTIGSSQFEQSSYEWPEKGTGVFTWFLVQGMSGQADESPYGNSDGVVISHELEQYVTQAVQSWAMDHNKIQTPRGKRNMTGDVVLGLVGGSFTPPEPTEPVRTQKTGMVQIPAGSFTMGCSSGDSECQDDEKPAKKVTLTKGFYMDATEVTQGEYERVMGKNPSYFSSCGADCPVEQVSWNDAKAYCEKVGKRLPTEAEWEYAARGGSTTTYYWGNRMDGSYAWYGDNSKVNYSIPSGCSWCNGRGTHPVGKKKANAFGLYDMSGNVWEWVADCYNSDWYTKMPATNPVNTCTGSGDRVLRGGSWIHLARDSRVSFRYWNYPVNWNYVIGFRCAQDF